ncbi:hypothetical protein ACFLVF_02420 [Chloroflexota bacterium]
MKRKFISLLGGFLLIIAVMPASPTPVLAVPLDGHDITFVDKTWDGTYSTWIYDVTSTSAQVDPPIGYWVLCWCDCNAIVDASEDWECGYDPPTATTGIQFTEGYGTGETRRVQFRLEGNYNLGFIEVAIQSGGDEYYGQVLGPVSFESITPDFSICLGTPLNDQLFIDNGVTGLHIGSDCRQDCDITILNWQRIDNLTCGVYTYDVTSCCECGCDYSEGTVTVVAPSTATAPPITLCEGYSQQELEEAVIAAGGGCESDCDGVTTEITDNGNGTYTVACTNACGTDIAFGDITIVLFCAATAPPITLCEGYSQQDLEAAVAAAIGGCECGIEVITDNGNGTYTVTCTNVCGDDSADGDITLCAPPVASAPPVTLCEGYSQQELEAAVAAADGGCVCSDCPCDVETITDNGDGTYTVYCENQCGDDSADGIITVCAAPVASAPPVTLCEGYSQQELEAAVAAADGGCVCGDCPCDVETITDNSDGTYTVYCENQCGDDSADGIITVCAAPVASAPPVTLCEGYSQQDLEAAMAAADGGCVCGDCQCSVETITDNGDGTYTVYCENQCGDDSADGIITVCAAPVASAPPVYMCEGYSQQDLEAEVLAAGGDCECGACQCSVETVTDNGDGTYTVYCENQCGNDSADGIITVCAPPVASAPPVILCEGYSQQELEAEVIAADGGCESGDCPFSVDTIVDNGDGTYTVTCVNECDTDTATGDIVVCALPVATAPPVVMCEGYSQEDLEAEVLAAGGGCHSETCPCIIETITDNGDGTYTVTCQNLCGTDTATGEIILCSPPVAIAPPVTLCEGYSQEDLEDAVATAGGGCEAGICDNHVESITDNGDGTYIVTCCNGCDCDCAEGTITVLPSSEASAPDFSICVGTVVNNQLFYDNGASCSDAEEIILWYNFDSSIPGEYPYTITCCFDCTGFAEGTVTVVDVSCEAIAPDFTINPGTPVDDQLFIDNGASASEGCEMTLTYDFDGTALGQYIYTVTSCNACGCIDAEGTVTVEVSGEPISYEVPLVAGFNLISLPLVPADPDFDTMMTGLDWIRAAKYVADENPTPDDWFFNNNPPPPPYDFATLNDGWGYWIEMNAAGVLTVTGYELAPPPPPIVMPPSYDVVTGWNLMGFKSTVPKLPEDYLSGIAGKYAIIYGYASGGFFLVGSPGYENLEPGLGYWIAMIEPGTIFP